MRKFTLMMSFVVIASLGFAQLVGLHEATTTKGNLQKVEKSQLKGGEDVYWEVTFEEETPVWSFGSDVGNIPWNVTDSTGIPAAWGDDVEGWFFFPLGRYSETGNEVNGHWAWVDIIGGYFDGSMEVCNTWIQFDNIDLTDASYPKLQFYQMYRPLNTVRAFVDISIDGGTTWSSIQVNDEIAANDYAPDELDLYIGDYAANESNVSLRFRWETYEIPASGAPVGYGWQLDDLKIIDNAEVDMVLNKGVMNFFQYNPDYATTGGEGAQQFHISSHYGQIPEEQFQNENAVMLFNGILRSKGMLEVTPDFNVVVLDPAMDEIYNETIAAPEAFNINFVDTLDLVVELSLGTTPATGEYTVIYNVNIADDEVPGNNVDTTYFYVTDNVMARDLDLDNTGELMTGDLSTQMYITGGNDGDKVGTTYLFLYDTEVLSMDIFISDRTTAGTSLVGQVMAYDAVAADYVQIGATDIFPITEEMLGTWQTLEFPDPVLIETVDGSSEILAVVEMYFGDGDLYIGADESVNGSIWGTRMRMITDDVYYLWEESGIGIRLITPESNAIAAIDVDQVNVYPNPSTGLFTIENVRGADVEIFNLVGQRVYTEQNLDQNVTVDLSNLSEGTYIVKISGTNTFKTQKINIVK